MKAVQHTVKRLSILLSVALVASTASAQHESRDDQSCYAGIPIGQFTRVPFIVQADADYRGQQYLPSADVFAQAVALKIREMLGGSATQLPQADSLISLDGLSGELIVTSWRKKPLTWRVPSWYPARSDTVAGSAISLLSKAVTAVVAEGDGIALPETFNGDSISFRLALLHPDVEAHTGHMNLNAREGEFAFTRLIPWGQRVVQLRAGVLKYPEAARQFPHMSSVVLAFTVDKSGKPIPESVREMWPYSGPIPHGPQLTAYHALARSIINDLRSVGYSPALLGGCRVEQVVTQEFWFSAPIESPERR